MDRTLGAPRTAHFAHWTKPQPTLKEIRAQFSAGISDEELLLRYMSSNEEVDAMLAAGPIRTDPRRSTSSIVANLTDLIVEGQGSRAVAVSTPGYRRRLAHRPQEYSTQQ